MKKLLLLLSLFSLSVYAQEQLALGQNIESGKSEPAQMTSERDADSVYVQADKMPEPAGGIMNLVKNVRYPKGAKKDGIEGTVFVNATIDESGRVANANVMRGVGHGCDEAAVSAVKKTLFTPAVKDGKKVKAKITIPIAFKLDGGHGQKTGLSEGQGNSGKSDDDVLITAEEMPAPVGGVEALMKGFTYPEGARARGVTGRVFIQFVVDEEGKPGNFNVIRPLDPECDAACVAFLKTSKWTPGKIHGKPVKVKVVFPVQFSLQ